MTPSPAANVPDAAAELRALIDASPLCLCRIEQRRFTLVSRAVEEISGYEATALIGRDSRLLYFSDAEYETVGRQIQEQIAQKGKFRLEARLRSRDGAAIWTRLSGNPIDAAHPEAGICFIAEDITAQRRGAVELETVLNAAPMAISCVVDRHYAWANPAFEALMGYTPAELQGRSTRILYESDEAFESFGRRHYPAIQSGETIRTEVALMTKDGHRLLCEISGRALEPEHPERGAIFIYRDITKRHEMESRIEAYAEKLAERNALLVKANRAKTDFLNTMQHELKTPLNAIIGFSELLAQGVPQPLPPEQQSFAQDILDAGRHLLDLINDILTCTRDEAGELVLRPEPVDVGTFLHGCIEAFRKEAAGKSVGLDLSVAADCGTIQADRQYLHMIIDNLLSNALKFTPAGGQVTVAARFASGRECDAALKCSRAATASCDRCVLISVADSGTGIADKDVHRLFQPFMQLQGGVTRPAGGTGLGLFLSRRLAELHGGSLDFQGTQAKGSTFILALPWHPMEEAEQAEGDS